MYSKSTYLDKKYRDQATSPNESLQNIADFSVLDPSVLQSFVDSASQSLQPISPEEAIDRFIEHKRSEVREQTLDEYRRKLGHFQDFCENRDIKNLNELDGRTINDFRTYRRTESADQEEPLSRKTMNDDMYLLREFLRFLGNIEAVPSDLSSKVDIPKLRKKDGVRDINIDRDRVTEILEHLERYEYATRIHVVWVFFTHTGRRPGGLYALDLNDLHLNCEDPYIELSHRPGETELKNGVDGETEIHLSEDAVQIFQDYIETNRVDVTTDNGRAPFLTSTRGRLSKSTMRKYIYKFSRPCVLTGNCPHGRDPDSCEAAQSTDAASKCPSSEPPYALRHGYITAKLQEGAPAEVISGRCDVSKEIIEKHYDERDPQEKRKLRQKIFEEIREDQNAGGYL